MHLQPTSLLLLLSLTTSPVLSIPWPMANPQDAPAAVEPLKTDVDASDQAVNYGSFSPADAISKLLEECSEVGCSGAKEVEAETLVVDGNNQLQQMKIVISAEGSFNRDKKATREALVEIAKAVASQTTTSSEDSYFDACGTPFCDFKTMTQHRFTQSLHIATLEDGADDAFLNVFIKIDNPFESGFCEKLLAAVGAIGGAINGVVGGAFGLGALLCDS